MVAAFLSKMIPRQWLMTGLVIVIASLMVLAGISYVNNLRNDLEFAVQQLVAQKIVTTIQSATIENFQRQAADVARRMRALEISRNQANSEIQRMSEALNALDLEEEITRDPDTAARSLRARNSELNRMLERATRAPGLHGAGAAGADPPAAPGAR